DLVHARVCFQTNPVRLLIANPFHDRDHRSQPPIPRVSRAERAHGGDGAPDARHLLDDVVTLHVDQDLRPVLRRHDTVEIRTPHAILAPSRVVRPSQCPTWFGAGHSALDFSEPFEVFPAVELQPYGFANVLHLDVEEVFEPHAIPRSGQLRFGHLTLDAGEGRSLPDAQVRETLCWEAQDARNVEVTMRRCAKGDRNGRGNRGGSPRPDSTRARCGSGAASDGLGRRGLDGPIGTGSRRPAGRVFLVPETSEGSRGAPARRGPLAFPGATGPRGR